VVCADYILGVVFEEFLHKVEAMTALIIAAVLAFIAYFLHRAKKIKESNDAIYRRQLWEVRERNKP
jgi:hypothetical protein